MLFERKNHNSRHYFGSTVDRNDPHLKELRRIISEFNARGYFEKPKRVVIRGRDPKVYDRFKYYRSGEIVGGLDNAGVFDVYVYER